MSAVTDLIGNATDSSYTAPNFYQPSNLSQAGSNYYNTATSNLNTASAATPAWQTYLSQLTNNPYQAGAQTASNTAGGAYTTAGNQAINNGANIAGASTSLLNTAMNPQSALYNQQQQNNTDQTNASLAARGLNTSAAGADLAQQSNTNFNTNWTNNLQGLQSQAIGTAGTGYNNANNLNTSGAGSINTGGALPNATYNSGVSTLGSGLGTYGSGVNSLDQNALAQIMSYLQLGTGQQQSQYNAMNNYTQTQNDMNNQMWGDIGNIAGGAALALA